MDIIYCAGANERLMQIAYDTGYLLGVRSDRSDYGFPIAFVDIDYKKPDFAKHLARVASIRPRYAIVPDLSETEDSEEDAQRAVKQADALGAYCDYPLIVPKRSGQLQFIPARYAIAYSLPTSYGGAKFGIWKLAGRHVHLLGGSPQEQMKLSHYHGGVISADGNMAQLVAVKFARYWQAPRQWVDHPERGQGRQDLYLDCWLRSCQNIYRSWQLHNHSTIPPA